MRFIKHQLFSIALLVLFSVTSLQAQNIFLDREFWKTNPSVKDIEQKMNEGHNATELNRYGFDAVTYALLENTNETSIKYLLGLDGNEVNKLTHDGRTYIFWAAYKNNMSIVKHLLNTGAKTDVIDDKGYTILNFAAVAGVENTKLYDLLIKNGANVRTDKTPKGANALLLIIPNLKDFKMIDYFTEKGLSLNSTDKHGNGVFNYVAQKDNRKMLELLIQKGISYKTPSSNGDNAMLFATKGSRRGYNSLEYFKYLEGLGVKPNITNKQGKTPLHNLAYSNKDVATINYFLNKKVNVNQVDSEGNTPLLNASRRNSLEIIKLLANKTSNINHTNDKGYSALTYALNNTPDVVRFFLDKNANVDIKDAKGNHLGYHMFRTFNSKNEKEFSEKLAMLEAKGLDVTKAQKDGNTLYHLAVEKQSIPMLDYIKKYTLDINAANAQGLTPLHLAAMTAKDDKLLKYLIANGANKKLTTEFSESVFDLASENELLKDINIEFLK